jgi:hypothetical protein
MTSDSQVLEMDRKGLEARARKVLAKQWSDELTSKLPAVVSMPATVRALLVIVRTDHIRDYLAEHDPQALRQAWKAIDAHFNL